MACLKFCHRGAVTKVVQLRLDNVNPSYPTNNSMKSHLFGAFTKVVHLRLDNVNPSFESYIPLQNTQRNRTFSEGRRDSSDGGAVDKVVNLGHNKVVPWPRVQRAAPLGRLAYADEACNSVATAPGDTRKNKFNNIARQTGSDRGDETGADRQRGSD